MKTLIIVLSIIFLLFGAGCLLIYLCSPKDVNFDIWEDNNETFF